MSFMNGWYRIRDLFAALSPRDRRAIVLGLMVLAPVLLWAGIVRPYLGSLDDLRSRLEVEQALLEREQRIVRNAPELSAGIESVREELERLQTRLVTADNPALAEAELSAHLEHLARSNRVLLQEVRSTTGSTPETDVDGTVPIYLSVSGESDFEGVLDFFTGIEQDRVLMKIGDVSLGPAPSAGESGNENRRGNQGGNQSGNQVDVVRFTAVVVAFMAEPVSAGGVEQMPGAR